MSQMPFGHHQASPGSGGSSHANTASAAAAAAYDPTRAYTEYAASYYAASRHVLGAAANSAASNNSGSSSAGSSVNNGVDADLHNTFYRNGLFSAAAAAVAANSSDASLFRVSLLWRHSYQTGQKGWGLGYK
jgi:ABC-type sulfate transport system substrate-binding protein